MNNSPNSPLLDMVQELICLQDGGEVTALLKGRVSAPAEGDIGVTCADADLAGGNKHFCKKIFVDYRCSFCHNI